jgi:hypothetical protein
MTRKRWKPAPVVLDEFSALRHLPSHMLLAALHRRLVLNASAYAGGHYEGLAQGARDLRPLLGNQLATKLRLIDEAAHLVRHLSPESCSMVCADVDAALYGPNTACEHDVRHDEHASDSTCSSIEQEPDRLECWWADAAHATPSAEVTTQLDTIVYGGGEKSFTGTDDEIVDVMKSGDPVLSEDPASVDVGQVSAVHPFCADAVTDSEEEQQQGGSLWPSASGRRNAETLTALPCKVGSDKSSADKKDIRQVKGQFPDGQLDGQLNDGQPDSGQPNDDKIDKLWESFYAARAAYNAREGPYEQFIMLFAKLKELGEIT